MAQYINSLILVLIGTYVVLLGFNVRLAPLRYRGKKIAILLGVIILAGGVAAYPYAAMSDESLVSDIVKAMKKKINLPAQVDETTSLDDLIAERDAIVYVMTIQKDEAETRQIVAHMAQQIMQTACQNNHYIKFLRGGITVKLLYRDSAGSKMDPIVISPTICGL